MLIFLVVWPPQRVNTNIVSIALLHVHFEPIVYVCCDETLYNFVSYSPLG